MISTIADMAWTLSGRGSKRRFFGSRVRRRKTKRDKTRRSSGSETSSPLIRDTGIPKDVSRVLHPDAKRPGSGEDSGEGCCEAELDWSEVPSDAPRRAGILIVTTSPEGKVKVADCDKEAKQSSTRD
ncbi:uncharacterized protein CIMG_01130 [Coccidioides immitis RS]|uniref:Uncharacterized protein n=4 Tax=Coccidioides immitis TaxID=5501 RepID=J3KIH8_COCIM|nr:uncharacterized protein CIMG_01130 [Coccidioides immitis RS]EAS35776.3 hypothetical protein CIMG_01130 [Coccidioides immitis RS]TPX26012.1 hypothetical protein DIZ76_011470 [Coccidioides immitis]